MRFTESSTNLSLFPDDQDFEIGVEQIRPLLLQPDKQLLFMFQQTVHATIETVFSATAKSTPSSSSMRFAETISDALAVHCPEQAETEDAELRNGHYKFSASVRNRGQTQKRGPSVYDIRHALDRTGCLSNRPYGITIAGGAMLWGGELTEFGRRACMIGLVVSVPVFAAPMLASAFGVAAAVV